MTCTLDSYFDGLQRPVSFEGLSHEPREMCPHCGGTTHFAFLTRDRNLRVTKAPFCYRLCTLCGLIFLESVPSYLARYYPTAYYTLPRSEERLKVIAHKEQFKLDL